MAEHHRLDEFTREESSDADPQPPEPTYRWSPNGETCSGCGSSVVTFWTSEHGLICADCKEW